MWANFLNLINSKNQLLIVNNKLDLVFDINMK